jgi:protoheme IX farnesyltransferase
MLTAVQSEKTSSRIIAISTLVMVLFSITPFFMLTENNESMIGPVYLWTAIASGAVMVGLSFWVIKKAMERAAWTLFKFSSPYLAVLFIALMVDSAL